MLLPRIGLLLSAASAACAFDGASPFFLVSSDPLPSNAPLKSCQIAKTFDVQDRLIETLADCTADRYVVIGHDGVTTGDFQGEHGFTRTRQSLSQVKEGALVDIPNAGVLGEPSGGRIFAGLLNACEKKGRKPYFQEDMHADGDVFIQLWNKPALSADEQLRAKTVAETDKFLADRIDAMMAGLDKKSILIYVAEHKGSQTEDSRPYEMEGALVDESLHTDLKRDVLPREQNGSTDGQIGLPLFETYQFLTPGLFMGLSVSLLLLAILYVGVGAIANLQVSYAAFTKDMVQQAQKKQL